MKFQFLLILWCLPLISFAQEDSFIIQLNSESSTFTNELKKNDFTKSDYELNSIFPELNVYEFTLLKNTKRMNSSKLKSYKSIGIVNSNRKVELRNTPNDELYSNQWSLEKIEVEEVWKTTTGSKTILGDDIVVAIIDEGFDINHEDIRESIWKNLQEIPNNNIDDDQNGFIDDYLGPNVKTDNGNHKNDRHGTSVASIIGAKGNNRIGTTGIIWDANLMLISGMDDIAGIIKGYNYVYQQRLKYNNSNGTEGAYVVVTNLSAGVRYAFQEDSPIWCSLYDILGEVGVLSVSSTTNDYNDIDNLGDLPPHCDSEYLIIATNTDEFDEKANNAGYSSTLVDLAAPGESILSHTPNSLYSDSFSGTSASAPHIAGAIGLLYSTPCASFIEDAYSAPQLIALRVKDAILSGVDALPNLLDLTVSGGRLNIKNSFELLGKNCIENRGEFSLKNIIISNIGNTINIHYETPDFSSYELRIFDMVGHKIYESIFLPPIFEDKVITINNTSYNAGIYIVQLRNSEIKMSKKIFVGNTY